MKRPDRSCRKRCMGCDECWVCRRSYPSSVIITDTVGGGSYSGPNGCACGSMQGTYSVGPWGSEIEIPSTSGLPVFNLFNHQSYNSVNGELNGVGGPDIGKCYAAWQLAQTFYTARNNSAFSFQQIAAIELCTLILNDAPSPFDIELMEGWSGGSVRMWIGQNLFGPKLSGNAFDRRIFISISQRNFKFVRSEGLFVVPWYFIPQSYIVNRTEFFELILPENCPESGVFDVPFAPSIAGIPGRPNPSIEDVWAGLSTARPDCLLDTEQRYTVQVDLS